jgi:hypothetical protein
LQALNDVSLGHDLYKSQDYFSLLICMQVNENCSSGLLSCKIWLRKMGEGIILCIWSTIGSDTIQTVYKTCELYIHILYLVLMIVIGLDEFV